MNLSYRIHTGEELELMKRGDKPLSMFSISANVEDFRTFFPVEEFDDLTVKGFLVKRNHLIEVTLPGLGDRKHQTRYIMYARYEESWRINAMILLLHTQIKVPYFDEGLDRMMGSLLGYSDHENDEFQSESSRLRQGR